MSDRYVQVNARGELAVMGENTVTPGPWLAALAKHAEGYPITAIVGDRFRHAEFIEALQKSGLSRVPYVSRGMG